MAKHHSSTGNQEVRPGVYIHYKQKKYKVIGCAKHTETDEAFVVYQNLYGNRELWVRPKAMFLEFVEVGGNRIPRFKYISEHE